MLLILVGGLRFSWIFSEFLFGQQFSRFGTKFLPLLTAYLLWW